MNLGYDMFDELKHNMDRADHFAHLLNCTRLSKLIGRDVEGINSLRFELDETEVKVLVEYSYSDPYHDDYIHEGNATFEMNDDMEFVFNPIGEAA